MTCPLRNYNRQRLWKSVTYNGRSVYLYAQTKCNNFLSSWDIIYNPSEDWWISLPANSMAETRPRSCVKALGISGNLTTWRNHKNVIDVSHLNDVLTGMCAPRAGRSIEPKAAISTLLCGLSINLATLPIWSRTHHDSPSSNTSFTWFHSWCQKSQRANNKHVWEAVLQLLEDHIQRLSNEHDPGATNQWRNCSHNPWHMKRMYSGNHDMHEPWPLVAKGPLWLCTIARMNKWQWNTLHTCILRILYVLNMYNTYIIWYILQYTSSTAQGGRGSFKIGKL